AVQECTTDSEELMYHQVRASSSCSAPPDLLLVSERDNNIQLRSPVVNIITTPPGNASGSASKHHHNQHHGSMHPHHNHNSSSNAGRHTQSGNPHPQDVSSGGGGSHSKHLRISSGSNGRHGKYSQQQAPQQDEDVVDAAAAMTQQQQHGGHNTHSRHLHHHKEERIRLEEFTCDVSVEGGKSSQPLQFSFTFYDLDGHHGKITKDDIVGIVYTIYESIGKSVVVPHCGSKTINVRLTVSPEGKSKAQPGQPNVGAGFGASKLKKLPTGLAAMSSKTVAGTGGNAGAGATALTTSAGSRRQHRYRPRKLIKSDDEDDDSNSEKDAVPSTDQQQQQQPSGSGGKASGKTGHHHQARYHQKNNARPEQCCPEQHTPDNGHNTYENMLNLKCCKPESGDRDRDLVDCPTGQRQHQLHSQQQQQQQQRQQDIYMKQATQRVKMLRRARKQKYQDHCLETRQRSLSVGNDSNWQNRHLQQQQQQQQQTQASPAQPLNHKSVSVSPPLGGAGSGGGELMLDGVQLRQPRPQSLNHHHQQQQHQQQQQRKSAECWKSALNRNDLISIIRESMEKNRLCFQLNGKPQANVSPIRQPAAQQQQQQQRQRCNTGSKIPTLIANHSPVAQQSPLSCSPPTADTTCIPVPPASNEVSAGHQQQQQQQQQHSHHEHPQPHIPIYHQQLAINPAVLAAQQTHNTAHNKLNLCGYDSFLHATICGGGAAAHSPPPTPSNVATVQPIPKKNQKNLLQGYQRLDQQQLQQQQQQQKEQKEQRSSKDYRNYGNLIYAKLSEQLQQKEREQRRHRHKQQQQQQQQQQQNQLLQEKSRETEQAEQRPPTSNSSSGGSKIYGDALECAHLLASEEEDLPPSPQLTSTPSKVVSTDTLIDLNDDVGEAVAEAVTEGGKQSLEAEEGQAQEVELDTSASSSMIHRYVHEHIHHHYHHFKEQQDV
ncbi:hypothetical protein KR054_004921, partial [Drosophila jambulina]